MNKAKDDKAKIKPNRSNSYSQHDVAVEKPPMEITVDKILSEVKKFRIPEYEDLPIYKTHKKIVEASIDEINANHGDKDLKYIIRCWRQEERAFCFKKKPSIKAREEKYKSVMDPNNYTKLFPESRPRIEKPLEVFQLFSKYGFLFTYGLPPYGGKKNPYKHLKSDAVKKRTQKQITCPHCGETFDK